MAKLAIYPALADTFTGNLTLNTQAEVDAASIYTSVSGSVSISGADIHDLSPLAGLASIGSGLNISNNPALIFVADAFPALTSVGGGIYFYNDDNLTSFSGFDLLEQTGDNIDIWYNDSLVTVSGFGSLHTLGWSLEIGGNPLLTQIPSFPSLRVISSSLFILDNISLARITGFRALQEVDWSFTITGNTKLASLCGFYDYFYLNNPYSGGGTLTIQDNHPILPNPTSIQDVLNAGPCSPLLKLSGFAYEPATGDSEVSITGTPTTAYKLVEADDLDFSNPELDPIPLTGATVGAVDLIENEVRTDGSGNATVQFNLGTAKSATFLRAESTP